MSDLRVYKYKLELGLCKVSMPAYSKPLSVGFQGKDLQLWALVDPETRLNSGVTFLTVGTGHDTGIQFLDQLHHIGTSHIDGLVFHTFEVSQ